MQDPDRVADEWTRRGAEDGAVAHTRDQRDEAQRLLAGQQRTLPRRRHPCSSLSRRSRWRVEALLVKLRKEVADRLGAERSLFHPGTVEVPVALVQAIGETVVLTVGVDGLRQALPAESESAPAS